jgi:hypothetical protein
VLLELLVQKVYRASKEVKESLGLMDSKEIKVLRELIQLLKVHRGLKDFRACRVLLGRTVFREVKATSGLMEPKAIKEL